MLKKFSLSWRSKDLLKFAWTIYIIITTVFIITAPLNIDFNFDRLLFPTSQIQILPFFLQNGFCQIFSGWLGIQLIIVCVYFWNLFVYISFSFRGPCVRKLLTGLIMYIYPLKIKNIVLYCIVLHCFNCEGAYFGRLTMMFFSLLTTIPHSWNWRGGGG